jgi:hypothetical protein
MSGTPPLQDILDFSGDCDVVSELAIFKNQIESIVGPLPSTALYTWHRQALTLLRSGNSNQTFQLAKIMLACRGELKRHPYLMGFVWTDENIVLVRGEFLWNEVAPLVLRRRIYKRKLLGLLVGEHQKAPKDVYTFSELVETVIGRSLRLGFHFLQNWGLPSFRVLRSALYECDRWQWERRYGKRRD